MNLIEKFKNYFREQKLQHQSKDYAVLLENFDLEGVKNVNSVFRELKNSPISIIATNEGSKEWSLLINWKQNDDLDHSKNIIDTMSPVLAKFKLKIEGVWLR